MKFECSRLVLGLFLEAIALCLIISFRFINIESTATLLIFNLFFSPSYSVEWNTQRKLGVLSLGNIIGLFWNFVLHYFDTAGVTFFGDPFNVFYAVSYPFLNFMWIVSFWSLSLTVLPKPKSTSAELKP